MYKRGRKIIDLLFVMLPALLLYQAAYTQETFFDNFLEDEGLPSNEVYDILVSSDGYLWFATENGVSRYDGMQFRNFSIEEGLAANSVIKLYEDSFNRLWFLSYNGMLSYYEHGRITPYIFNDTLIKYFTDNYFSKIYIDSARNMFVSPRQGGMGMIDREGHLQDYDELVPRGVDSCYLYFKENGNDHFITILNRAPEQCRNGKTLKCGDEYFLKINFSRKEFQRHFLRISKDNYLVSYRDRLFLIKNDRVVKSMNFKEEVISLYADNAGRIWVSVKYDNGVYIFGDYTLSGTPEHLLDGFTITGVIQDREGYYWMSSEGNGVFYAESFEFSVFSVPGLNRPVNIMAMDLYHDKLWFSTREKEIYSGRLSGGRISQLRRLNLSEPYDWIKHVVVDYEGYLWLSSTRELCYDPAGFPHHLDTIGNFSYVGRGSGDSVIVANSRLGFYYRSRLVSLFFPPIDKRIYTTWQRDKDIWVGTLYGLYVLRNVLSIDMGSRIAILANRINSLGEVNDMLVVGTATNGLAFLKNDSLVVQLTEQDGLRTNNITTLFTQDDSTLWAGSKNGLHKVRITGNTGASVLESYGPGDGLPSSEINAIIMHEGFIWLATNIGLVSFDPSRVKPFLVPPLINISGVQINGMDTVLLERYELGSDQNNIRIVFQPINYRKGGEIRYRYRMEGLSDEYIFTQDKNVDFLNLPPGEYSFSLAVSNTHNEWNEAPQNLRFEIRKHFTQTTGFMIFLIMASIGVLLTMSLLYQWQRRVKAEARTELARMEQRIFRLQMNPHFVFNALLAIQGFMYQRNVHEAGRYLTSFAKLIRHTLYGSSEELMPLDKEIEALRYYLELQRLRFNNNFDFEIEVGEDISPETLKIPPMLIQPFLENAIEHGLQHKKDGIGMLNLKFYRDEQVGVIEIRDNGIGREESMNLQKKKGMLHKSMGMNIVKKRLNSLNKLLGTNIRLKIIDLDPATGSSTGTIVRIYIPY